ncbi:hypothetical protein GCWU000342_00137 [Shuttleworthella satelles DSM 14600]|uniref:Uncharacterized protein n=1 Tax=Shuttleworthella satelles DSM 14600 TaxID=626523 RepID=C4G842_9FIRM|nr:hypothetical protein GCWU000342_00137 [Shuttleworthia satelles DSM 14600]
MVKDREIAYNKKHRIPGENRGLKSLKKSRREMGAKRSFHGII